MTHTQDRNSAISQAVSPFLSPQQTAEALHLWKTKYAEQPNVSVQYFARECSNMFSNESGRSQMVKNLVRELYTQLHALDHIQIRTAHR